MLFFFQGKTAPNALWPKYPNFGENLFDLFLFPNKEIMIQYIEKKYFFGWKRGIAIGTYMTEV